MRSRPLFQIVAAALVLAASALPCAALAAPIDPGTVSDAEMSSFVRDRLGSMGSGDPVAVREARIDLIAPLFTPETDSAFRLQYSGALQQGGLAKLASGDDELVAINAVVIAGDLATQLSVAILDQALSDDRPAVRYEAARSMGLLLAAYARGQAAIPANQIEAVFERIDAQFKRETNELVIDALVAALAATPDDDPEIRAHSARMMCGGVAVVARQWRTIKPDETHALIIFRAIDSAYSDLLAVQGGVDKDFARSAAIASGQALIFLIHWLDTTPPTSMTPATRQLAIDLGAAAERVLLLAHNTLTGDLQPERVTRPLREFAEGKPGATLATIRDAVEAWTGPSGRLLSAPYNVNADDFD